MIKNAFEYDVMSTYKTFEWHKKILDGNKRLLEITKWCYKFVK